MKSSTPLSHAIRQFQALDAAISTIELLRSDPTWFFNQAWWFRSLDEGDEFAGVLVIHEHSRPSHTSKRRTVVHYLAQAGSPSDPILIPCAFVNTHTLKDLQNGQLTLRALAFPVHLDELSLKRFGVQLYPMLELVT